MNGGGARLRVSGNLVEGLALLAIAVAVTFGGRALLAELHAFEPAAICILGAGILAMALSVRRVSRGGESLRLDVSVRVAYVTALLLAMLATLVPLRWTSGAAIAMVDIAIAFDLFARASSRDPR